MSITCGNTDWPLENTHQAAKQRIHFIHCPVLIHNWSRQFSVFPIVNVCVGSLLEVLRKPDKIILDFMLQPKLRHPCAQYPNQIISKSHRGHIKDLDFSAEQDFFLFFGLIKQDIRTKKITQKYVLAPLQFYFGLLADELQHNLHPALILPVSVLLV